MSMGAKPLAPIGASQEPLRLRCLGGATLPDEQREEARRVDKMSEEAIRGLGELLAPMVLEPLTRELGERLSRFCLRHELAEADLGHVLRVCRWLLREAANTNLAPADLEHDIGVVWGDNAALRSVLLEHYPPIKELLRERLVADALRKHGNVLLDVDWRIDELKSERNAARLEVPVALVTLAYGGAGPDGRLTLQLTAEQLGRLAQMFTALSQKVRLAQPQSER